MMELFNSPSWYKNACKSSGINFTGVPDFSENLAIPVLKYTMTKNKNNGTRKYQYSARIFANKSETDALASILITFLVPSGKIT